MYELRFGESSSKIDDIYKIGDIGDIRDKGVWCWVIVNAILDTINTIIEEFRDMKSNIINIQEQDNNSIYKLDFWGNVAMIMVSTLFIISIVALFLLVILAISISVGLKPLLFIIVVGVVIYAMIKTEVFYKLLYKLFKKEW